MGEITPNIGLFIPASGETLYGEEFAQGMQNLDDHDHSGGPNKGLPVTSSGLADGSVTFEKLNSNVADITTGIGTNSTPGLQNQLILLGILKNLYVLSNVPSTGFVAMNGATVAARTFQNTSTITWTNANGTAGDPAANLVVPVTVANGGTQNTAFTQHNQPIFSGSTDTGAFQQVAAGTAGQVLTSNGTSLPSWQSGMQHTKTTLTSTQIKGLFGSSIILVPAQGANTIITVMAVTVRFVYGGSNQFANGGGLIIKLGSAQLFGPTTLMSNISIDGAADKFSFAFPSTFQDQSSGVLDNTDLTITNGNSLFTGNAANDNKLIVDVYYTVSTLT